MYKKEIFLEIDANLNQPIQSMEADSNSRAIRFYLTSNYAPLNLKDKKVIFKAVKPDSTDIVNDCEIIDVEKGIVETKVTKQLNAVPGRVNCQLSIIGANDYVLKTKKFVISVDSKLTESGIISSREYKTLENALSEVHEINKNFEQVNAKIDEVATKGTTVEVIEEVTKEEIERQIADGTIAHLMIEDGSVTPEKTSFYDEIATQKKLLKNAEFDYMGNNQNTVKKAIDSSIDWVLGEVNTAHHEGQHITATDTIEGHAKSATLKGQTLVNLLKNAYISDGVLRNSGISYSKADTTYTLIYNVTALPTTTLRSTFMIGLSNGNTIYQNTAPTVIHNMGINKWVFKVPSDATFSTVGYWSNNEDVKLCANNIVLLEGDYTQENIPYFEGIQSVKMPVLTTTGKNLWRTDLFNSVNFNSYYAFTGYTLKQLCPSLIVGETYIASMNYQYTGSISGVVGVVALSSFTQLNNPFIYTEELGESLVYLYGGNVNGTMTNIQIEKGSVSTSYEPYKSNILTVNEDVTLRGIGDVKDTLDLLTGVMTERIVEIVLDGSDDENWNINENGNLFVIKGIDEGVYNYTNPLILTDKFNAISFVDSYNGVKDGVSFGASKADRLCFHKTGITTLEDWKLYIQENPITAQYALATESIKTVDLSGDAVYSYNEVTHYDCSSEEGSLVPTLSVDVPTNLPALVSRQRATIETQKAQIQTLEIENEQLIEQNQVQDEDIALNQDAINFMLFASEMLADDNKTKGVNTMAAYLANQILKGKLDYSLVVSRYPQFKEDVDTILILEGEENLIK